MTAWGKPKWKWRERQKGVESEDGQRQKGKLKARSQSSRSDFWKPEARKSLTRPDARTFPNSSQGFTQACTSVPSWIHQPRVTSQIT